MTNKIVKFPQAVCPLCGNIHTYRLERDVPVQLVWEEEGTEQAVSLQLCAEHYHVFEEDKVVVMFVDEEESPSGRAYTFTKQQFHELGFELKNTYQNIYVAQELPFLLSLSAKADGSKQLH